MKTRYFEGRKQNCDICHATDLSIYFDMPYQSGHWANLCVKCRKNASNPDHPAGVKFVKGKHPNADEGEKPKPFTMGAVLADKAQREKELTHANSLTIEEIENMMFDGDVETADGCMVEPDGSCPHGYRSPLLVLGLM